MNTESTAVAVDFHITNSGFIGHVRIQKNGLGKARVLIPCFFGWFWKTWKQYVSWYDGGGFNIIEFDSVEAAWLSVERWNAKWAKHEIHTYSKNNWSDDVPYCR